MVRDHELTAATRGRDPHNGNMHWMLGLDRNQTCCLWWWDRANVVVSLFAAGTGESVAALLCGMVGKLVSTA